MPWNAVGQVAEEAVEQVADAVGNLKFELDVGLVVVLVVQTGPAKTPQPLWPRSNHHSDRNQEPRSFASPPRACRSSAIVQPMQSDSWNPCPGELPQHQVERDQQGHRLQQAVVEDVVELAVQAVVGVEAELRVELVVGNAVGQVEDAVGPVTEDTFGQVADTVGKLEVELDVGLVVELVVQAEVAQQGHGFPQATSEVAQQEHEFPQATSAMVGQACGGSAGRACRRGRCWASGG